MIPKIIHYCWFGGNPLDDKSVRCIESWKKFFPDYEIKQWNENNFDIKQNKFMEDAYKDKKWAYVSDVARLIIIYQNGGVYFDTDVEVISSYDTILKECEDGFIGFEKTGLVASGLGFGAVPNHSFLKQLIDIYETISYENYRERIADIACTIITTQQMKKEGLQINDSIIQKSCGLTIYPSEYFSPIDYDSGKMIKTENTHSIHWYTASWKSEEENKTLRKVQRLGRIVGNDTAWMIIGIEQNIKREGLFSYMYKTINKHIRGKE